MTRSETLSLFTCEVESCIYIGNAMPQPMSLETTHISSTFPPVPCHSTLLKAGINVCANQKLNTSFGPVISSFGVSPLKKEPNPSFLAILLKILNPLSGFSKFLFCMRVLMTSRGAETRREAEAPAIEATKFWSHDAEL